MFIHSFIQQVDTEGLLSAQGVGSLDWEMANALGMSWAVTGNPAGLWEPGEEVMEGPDRRWGGHSQDNRGPSGSRMISFREAGQQEKWPSRC